MVDVGAKRLREVFDDLLHVKSLSQTFNAGRVNEVRALREIELHVAPRHFVTIIGSNGAGKSTLFNAIAGVFEPTQGRIVIDGEDVTAWPEYRRAALVGRVFQQPGLGTAASMTIAENLMLALLRHRRMRLRTGVTRELEERFATLLHRLDLGLEQRLDTPVALLSGGQRQALAVLMASLAQPKILLLDEHTAALDPATAVKIVALTEQIVQEQKMTTLMITHNMQQALDLGDRTLMMDGGQIILDLNAGEKAAMAVQDLIDSFTAVRKERLLNDRLLLSA